MAKERLFDTRFWSDIFVVEKLNPLDRYLFLYFLLNEKTNLSGIYEISLKTVSSETGIEKDDVERMMDRFKGKIEHKDGWICIVNFLKYQRIKNKFINIGIEKEISKIPKEIKDWTDNLRAPIGHLQVPSHLIKLNLIKPNLTKETVAVATPPIFLFEEELEKLKNSERKDFKIIALYWKKKGFVFENQKQFNSSLKRELRPASSLIGYSGEQISRAMKYCEDNYEKIGWTLETCRKRIAEVVNKK